jgi:hypothetical protein
MNWKRFLRRRRAAFSRVYEPIQWRRLGRLHDGPQTVRWIRQAFQDGRPFAAAKIGATELNFLLWNMGRPVDPNHLEDLHHQAGVFPRDLEFYRRYHECFVEALRALDLLGVWFAAGERLIYERHGMKAECADFMDMEGNWPAIITGRQEHWSEGLRGKRVMVISGFASIMAQRAEEAVWNQYWAGRLPWPGWKEIIPVPFSYGFEPAAREKFRDSLELLEFFKQEHAEALAASDAVLVGCGAYSVPLVHWAKSGGKPAIHLGGSLQILFGLRGRRWEEFGGVWKDLFNEHWIRPPPETIPSTAQRVERSAYW